MITIISTERDFNDSQIARTLSWATWQNVFFCRFDDSISNVMLLGRLAEINDLSAFRYVWQSSPKPSLNVMLERIILSGSLDILRFILEEEKEAPSLPEILKNAGSRLSTIGNPHNPLVIDSEMLAFLIELPAIQDGFRSSPDSIARMLMYTIRQRNRELCGRILELAGGSLSKQVLTRWVNPDIVKSNSIELINAYFVTLPDSYHQAIIACNDFSLIWQAARTKNHDLLFVLHDHPDGYNFFHRTPGLRALLFTVAALEGKRQLMQDLCKINASSVLNMINTLDSLVTSCGLDKATGVSTLSKLFFTLVSRGYGYREVVTCILDMATPAQREQLFSKPVISLVLEQRIGYLIDVIPPLPLLAQALEHHPDLPITRQIVDRHRQNLHLGTLTSAFGELLVTSRCDINDFRLLISQPEIREKLSSDFSFLNHVLNKCIEHESMEKLRFLLTVDDVRNRLPPILHRLPFQSASQISRQQIGFLYSEAHRTISHVGPFDYLLPAFYEEAFLIRQAERMRDNTEVTRVNINVNHAENSMHTGGSLSRIAENARRAFPQGDFNQAYLDFVEYVASRLEALEGHRYAETHASHRRRFIPEKQEMGGQIRDASGMLMSSKQQEIAILHTVMRLFKRDPCERHYGSHEHYSYEISFENMMGMLYSFARLAGTEDALVNDVLSIRRGHNSDKDPYTHEYLPRATSDVDWMTCYSGYQGRCWQAYAFSVNLLQENDIKRLHPFDASELRVGMHGVVREQITRCASLLPAADARAHLANLVHFCLTAPIEAYDPDEHFRDLQQEARAAITWVSDQIDISAAAQQLQKTVAPSVNDVIVDEQRIRSIAQQTLSEGIGFLADEPVHMESWQANQYQTMQDILLERVLPALLAPELAEQNQGLDPDNMQRLQNVFAEGMPSEKTQKIQKLIANKIESYLLTPGHLPLSSQLADSIKDLVERKFVLEDDLSAACYKASQIIRRPLQIKAWVSLQNLCQQLGFRLPADHLFDETRHTVNQLAGAVLADRQSLLQRYQTRLWQRIGPLQQLDIMAHEGLAPASLKLAELHLNGQIPTLTASNRDRNRAMADRYSLMAARQAACCGDEALFVQINEWRQNNKMEEAQLDSSFVPAQQQPRVMADDDYSDDDLERTNEPVAASMEVRPDYSLRDAVTAAVTNYRNWHRGGLRDEGARRGKGRGFFSWLRHGELGINNASQFNQLIESIGSAEDCNVRVLDMVIALLSDRGVRLHRHSFATYVLDSIQATTNLAIVKNRDNIYSRREALEKLTTLRGSLSNPDLPTPAPSH